VEVSVVGGCAESDVSGGVVNVGAVAVAGADAEVVEVACLAITRMRSRSGRIFEGEGNWRMIG